MSEIAFHFVCVAAHHRAQSSNRTSVVYVSPLTIHAGEWSYCPAGLMTDHEWRAIVPTTLDELKRNAPRERQTA